MTLINNIANYSFLSLLGSMIFYWIGAISPVSKVRVSLFKFGTLPKVADLAHYGIIISNCLLTLLLILRWKESGHFPLSNLYESLMFLSWGFTGLHLFIENQNFSTSSLVSSPAFREGTKKEVSQTEEVTGTNFQRGNQKGEDRRSKGSIQKLLGSITTPSALLTNAFAAFTLPKEMQEAAPLVPALQSNWLMMHVTVMILSYAALILGSLLSIAFLIVTGGKELNEVSPEVIKKPGTKPTHPTVALLSPTVKEGSSTFEVGESGNGFVLSENLAFTFDKGPQIQTVLNKEALIDKNRLSDNQTQIALILDNLSYRILGIGFPFLTIGILSGAVWANEAWGSYWSWDPKETWALLTWLIFAIYLHARLSKGWEGQKPAIIASFGFVIVWICYLGVNLIGEGLHSYGWIVQS